MRDIFWCSNCLAMSTRNRITFDEKKRCNACQWSEEKKTLDWGKRKKLLLKILDDHRSNDNTFDCLVPVSGGKDGSYVAYQLKEIYGMNPLCVTVNPPLQLDIGKKNLENFHEAGFSLISVNPNVDTMRYLNKNGLIDMGSPYHGWLTAIQSIPVRFALNFGINLIFYGEDGEIEYGGSKEKHSECLYDVEYMKKVYLEGGYDQRIENARKNGCKDLELLKFPNDKNFDYSNLKITHWSYFENWDPYRNYLTAKNHCGLIEADQANSGTFTNFAQNDQALYTLHTYLMYLKFGFGRANQDACIEIRRGAMEREQALNLVNLYDGKYPEEFIDIYLDYYQMTKEEFDLVLDKWANKNLFIKTGNIWEPTFVIK